MSHKYRGSSHRLPPICRVPIVATAGSGIVAADIISWLSLSVKGTGTLVMAGTGWIGWDSAVVLFAPPWTTERGMVKELNQAPPFQVLEIEF